MSPAVQWRVVHSLRHPSYLPCRFNGVVVPAPALARFMGSGLGDLARVSPSSKPAIVVLVQENPVPIPHAAAVGPHQIMQPALCTLCSALLSRFILVAPGLCSSLD